MFNSSNFGSISSEASYVLVLSLVAVLAAIYIFNYLKSEKKRDVSVFLDMKTRYFPKLLDNLRKISLKLESDEVIGSNSYWELLEKELSPTLLFEFKIRFNKQGHILSEFQEKLTAYDDKISLQKKTPESKELKNELITIHGELKEDVSTLVGEIEQLTNIERAPPRIPGFFRYWKNI